MIDPSNLVTQASSNTKEFMNSYSLEFASGTSLAEIYPALETLLVKETKNNQGEYTIKLTSEYESNKLILPLDIQLEAGDNLESIQVKYQKAVKFLIQGLKESKAQEATNLNSNITFDENSMQTQLDELTITNNLENNLLETDLQTNIQTKALISSDQIPVNKLEIITTDYDAINQKLDKLAKDESQTIQNTINQTDLKPIKKKIKKDSKQIKANTILKDYFTKKAQEEKRFKSASQKAKIDFDQAYQNNAPQSEIDKLIIKHQWTNIEIKVPTIREATETNTILNTLVESTQLTKSVLQIIEKNETKTNKENLKKDKTSKQAKKQNFSNIKTITKLRFKNSLYISKEQEAEDNKRFEADKKKEIEFQSKNYPNSGISNPANSNSSNSVNSSNPTNPKTAQTNTDNIFTQIANNLFGGSINAEARGLNNSNTPLYIYNYTRNAWTLDVPGSNANNGTEVQIWQRNTSTAQKWWLESETQEIKSDLNTNMCLDASGNNVTYGTAIILWQCNGGNNQKWTFDGRVLRSVKDKNFCIDIKNANFNWGVKIQLWNCNYDNDATQFVAGKDNFYNNFDVKLNATTLNLGSGNLTGHVFVSFWDNSRIVNTFSSWPGWDNDCNNSGGKENNICENDSIQVDDQRDWNNIDSGNFRKRTQRISKRVSDNFRYSYGYRSRGGYFGLINVDYNWVVNDRFSRNSLNCAYYSQALWNDVMDTDNKSNHMLRYLSVYLPEAIWVLL